ncbi:sigma-70 family RNA polymerase sigma factor [Homoserinimonas sp. A520]
MSLAERIEPRVTSKTVTAKSQKVTASAQPDTARRPIPGASDDAVRDYLQKIGSIPILTAEEEIELAICIEVGVLAQEKLDSGEVKPGTELARELRTLVHDGEAAYLRFFRSNLKLVVTVAKRYGGKGTQFMDLIQDGNLGLDRAVKKFDYRQGFKFSTYAMWWIKQAVARSVSEARLIRVPVHTAEKVASVRRTSHQLELELGRVPTPEELAIETNFSVEDIHKFLDADREPVSLHTLVGDDGGTELGDLIEDDEDAPVVDIIGALLRTELLRKKVADLPPREAEIIQMRFGLREDAPMTFTQVGSALGVSRERVRQIEHRALARLRCKELK